MRKVRRTTIEWSYDETYHSWHVVVAHYASNRGRARDVYVSVGNCPFSEQQRAEAIDTLMGIAMADGAHMNERQGRLLLG